MINKGFTKSYSKNFQLVASLLCVFCFFKDSEKNYRIRLRSMKLEDNIVLFWDGLKNEKGQEIKLFREEKMGKVNNHEMIPITEYSHGFFKDQNVKKNGKYYYKLFAFKDGKIVGESNDLKKVFDAVSEVNISLKTFNNQKYLFVKYFGSKKIQKICLHTKERSLIYDGNATKISLQKVWKNESIIVELIFSPYYSITQTIKPKLK